MADKVGYRVGLPAVSNHHVAERREEKALKGVRSSAYPEKWMRQMPKKGNPRPQENSMIKVEPATVIGSDEARHRRAPRHWDATPDRTDFDSASSDYLSAFEGKATNGWEAKAFVTDYNNQHRRGFTAEILRRSTLDYLNSLEQFNLCNNCQQPIRTKKVRLLNKGEQYTDEKGNVHNIPVVRGKGGRAPKRYRPNLQGNKIVSWVELKQYTHTYGSIVEYADIPEHYAVDQRADNPHKVEYHIQPATRVFNLKCSCFRRDERKEARAAARS